VVESTTAIAYAVYIGPSSICGCGICRLGANSLVRPETVFASVARPAAASGAAPYARKMLHGFSRIKRTDCTETGAGPQPARSGVSARSRRRCARFRPEQRHDRIQGLNSCNPCP
jgi:hypothetical protein